jgi:hypothetical protein
MWKQGLVQEPAGPLQPALLQRALPVAAPAALQLCQTLANSWQTCSTVSWALQALPARQWGAKVQQRRAVLPQVLSRVCWMPSKLLRQLAATTAVALVEQQPAVL